MNTSMKHISEYLVLKKKPIEIPEQARSYSVRPFRQFSLFSAPLDKGSSEWSPFNLVRDDTVDTYPVRVPKKPIVVAEPHHVLRIIYPPTYATHGV